MPLPSKNPFNFHPLARRLLKAACAPQDFAGASRCLQLLNTCLQDAADRWPDAKFQEWVAITQNAQQSLKNQTASDVLHLLSLPTETTRPFQQLLDWKAPVTKRGLDFECQELLGRAVARAASKNEPIATDLLNGLVRLRRAQKGIGKRSTEWDQALRITITNAHEVNGLLDSIPIKSPASSFLKSALTVLKWLPVPPPLVPSPAELSAIDSAEFFESSQRSESPFSIQRESDDGSKTKPKIVIPDIGVRRALANYASFSEKLGLPHRDRMLVNDLAPVTKQLFELAQTGSTKEKAYAVFATTSLTTGCTDSRCVKLGFDRSTYNIWLEIDKGAWAWDFSVYREEERADPRSSDAEPIYCPLPDFVVRHLVIAKTLNPSASCLIDLVETMLGGDKCDLNDYRIFLNNLGHPSHPPLRARFAKSLASVVLEVTKSDMSTGLLTGYFESSAPSALYYFGPTYQIIVERCNAVFSRLSLGPVSSQFNETGRSGCQKVLEIEQLKVGWKFLLGDIKQTQKMCAASSGHEEILTNCNLLLSLLASAFVVQTAHRGTRLECLTAGALFAHPDLMIINDKDDDDGRAQPRMVPKSSVVRKIFAAVAECHRWVQSALSQATVHSAHLKVSDPVFVNWRLESGKLCSHRLETRELRTHASHYFNSDVNFARSIWVTYLDHFQCDRWLIRSLTGHSRDITRIHGPYFDIPPKVVANRLSLEMDKVGELIFGNLAIAAATDVYPTLEHVHFRRVSQKMVLYGPVPDPRTLLSPLDADSLLEYQMVMQIRSLLTQGKISGPNYVLAALHLVFIDQIPERNLCIEAVSQKGKVLIQYGARLGVNWRRSHFIEPTWIPIQPSTQIFLERIHGAIPDRAQIVAEICTAVRRSGISGLPKSSNYCWQVMTSAAESFRRMTFPPSVCAVSDLAIPAPALSELSLRRFAGEDYPHIVSPLPIRTGPLQGGKKDEDLQHLVATLNKFSSDTERHGEKQARAAKCLDKLEDVSITWSPLVGWERDLVVDELRQTRAGHDGCYQISSISTYLSTLTTAQKQLDAQDDPRDWDDKDWSSWISAINVECGGIEYPEDQKEEGLLEVRAKNALAFLARSLRRRHEYVPAFLSQLLGVFDKTIYPRGSASSCLILSRDIDRSSEILLIRYKEYPGDFLILKFRQKIGIVVPLRTGDISSLTTKCMTPSGGLVIERVGYNVHKTYAAIRVVQLSRAEEMVVRKHILKLNDFFGPRELLLRGDGSPSAGIRDLSLSVSWNFILKEATGDHKARPHSVRAATLQEIAWPGWQTQSEKLMAGDLSAFQSQQWVQEQQTDWIRLSRATSMAGQSDLRSALGNYLAGWPLVYSILANATLADLSPGPELLHQLGITSDSLRQARSRALRAAEPGGTSPAFDPWLWIGSRQKKAAATDLIPIPQVGGKPVNQAPNSSTSAAVSDSAKLHYLIARCLGLRESLAMEKAGLPLRTALALESVLPTRELLGIAVKRGRKAPEERAMAADRDMSETDAGRDIILWLQQLKDSDFKLLGNAFFKSNTSHVRGVDITKFWPCVCACLPFTISLNIRIGDRYFSPADRSALSRLAPAARFAPDPRIGETPMIGVFQRGQKNLVQSARLTSVTRVAWLAIDALRKQKVTGANHAV